MYREGGRSRLRWEGSDQSESIARSFAHLLRADVLTVAETVTAEGVCGGDGDGDRFRKSVRDGGWSEGGCLDRSDRGRGQD